MWGPLASCASTSAVSTWVLQFFQVVLTWPVATFASIVFVATAFKEPVSRWLADLEAYFDGKGGWRLRRNPQLEAPAAPAAGPHARLPVNGTLAQPEAFPAGSRSADVEQDLLGNVAIALPDDNARVQYLAHLAVYWMLVAHVEWIYTSIFGSQIALLQAARNGHVEIGSAREFYENAVKATPNLYVNYPFESWLAWLTDTSRVLRRVAGNEGELELTYEGQKFIAIVGERGYTLNKLG